MEKKQSIEIELFDIEEGLILYIDAERENDIEINTQYKYNHEAKYQLKEGSFYDYTFSKNEYRLTCSNQSNIITKRTRDKHAGRIAPNIYVGTLTLEIYNINNDVKKWPLQLEVQSIKTSYREDYQYMLNSIAEKCTDLILQANSPVSHSFESNPNEDAQTLYQQFAFIKSMIDSENFDDAILRIISFPSTKWNEQQVITDVRQIKRFTSKNIRELIHSNNRIELNENHPLHKQGVKSVATKINSNHKTESVDTPENRFIKHALTTFLKFCEDIYVHKNAGERLKDEAKLIIEKLDNHLQNGLFREVSRPTTLKIGSPVLQKKEGYREVLNVWLKFSLAAKLIWQGGEEVYSGGKKDIAVLYEYWLFFKLIDLLKSIFEIEPKDLERLITSSTDGLGLQLRQGKFIALKGIYTKSNRNLNIQFSYNRSFTANSDLTKSGSWTTTLRPDYTLSIWPRNLKEKDAEKQEQIVHIHFDAKYKIANIYKIIDNKTEEDLYNEKKENQEGIYKNADLLKMHAYKDAIRRTAGAYVLYPGDIDQKLKGFHEVLPGLGAFPIKPSENSDETKYLKSFLKDVLNHFLNRTSQRENIAYKASEIHKNSNPTELKESLPEYINNEKLLPDETYVLVGFSKNDKRLKWYQENGKYNFRMNDDKGSLVFDNKLVDAKFLLLRESGKKTASLLYKIKPGVEVYSGERLTELGHPDANKKHYLVFEIETKSEEMEMLENITWDYTKLEEYKKITDGKNMRIAAGLPFVTSLSNLMRCKID